MAPVIDTNLLIHGRGKFSFDKAYTVPEVSEELESFDAEMTASNIELEFREPSEEALERVNRKAEEINAETSETDQKLLALAIALDETLVTDDKGLQNLALHLEADFEPFMKDRIEKKMSWKKVCENCGADFSGEKCSLCGSTSGQRKLDQCSSV